MLLKNIFVLATATFGLSNAACVLTGYTNGDCTGSRGINRRITSETVCIQMGGRGSYRLEGCEFVRIIKKLENECGGGTFDNKRQTDGCWRSHGKSLQARVIL